MPNMSFIVTSASNMHAIICLPRSEKYSILDLKAIKTSITSICELIVINQDLTEQAENNQVIQVASKISVFDISAPHLCAINCLISNKKLVLDPANGVDYAIMYCVQGSCIVYNNQTSQVYISMVFLLTDTTKISQGRRINDDCIITNKELC